MSPLAISEALSRLKNNGVPESIALLTIARRIVDSVCAALPIASQPAVRDVYRQLGTVSRDLVVLRDQLDEALAQHAAGQLKARR